MIEIRRVGADSQVYSALVDLDQLKRHFLMDLLGLGTERGTLRYDTTGLARDDLLVDRAIITIDDQRTDQP